MFPTFRGTRCREKKGESIQELFPTHPTYQNPIFMNPRPLLCKVSWIFGFSFFVQFFQFVGPHWTPLDPRTSSFSVFRPIDPLWVKMTGSNLVFCRPLPRPPRKSKIHGVGNPWGGKSLEIHEQIQDFWKLRFRQKVKVWKQVVRFIFWFFKFCGAKFQLSGTNFSRRFRIK